MSKPKKGDVIAVWFSCGAASAIAAKKTIELYGDYCEIRILNNPVIEEEKDNIRFMNDVSKWLGVEIETVINSKFTECSAVDVWDKRKYMSNANGEAPCTFELKKKARREWEDNNHADWHVLGFTAEETHRAERIVKRELPELLPILIHENISKADCFMLLRYAGIDLPDIYNKGYPNANCIGCVKATSPTYWNHVRKMHPDIFEARAEQSRRIGARLVRVKNVRIFLDELDPSATGRPLKSMHVECGIFCEENS